jgi:hypothetical protein
MIIFPPSESLVSQGSEHEDDCFWDDAPGGLVEIDKRIRNVYYLYLQDARPD